MHTTARKTSPPTPAPQPSLATPLLLTRYPPPLLLDRFLQLLSTATLAPWLNASQRTFYARAFTPLITLWYMVFQRLSPNHSLSAVQEDARAGGADRLSPPGKKPLSRQLRSEATTSYSDARQRVPRELFHQTLRYSGAHLHQTIEVSRPCGLKLALLDGTTVRFRPLGDLANTFPPHRPGNCKKPPYWCLARAVGALCWATGAVLDTALDTLKTSEQALCATILAAQDWQGWLLAADRNFGVHSVVSAIVAARGHALLRLTTSRARKLARDAGLTLAAGLDTPITWTPSSKDRPLQGVPHTPVRGRLLAVQVNPPGSRSFTLFLFTTLTDIRTCPAALLAEIYGRRWRIELNFRDIKSQMDMGFLECRSAQMLRKEWMAGLVAYNLIRWTMGVAAAVARVPVHQISFSRARELLWGWCLRHAHCLDDRGVWNALLERIAAVQLPKHRKPRPSEPRAARHFEKNVPKLEGSRADARARLAAANAKS